MPTGNIVTVIINIAAIIPLVRGLMLYRELKPKLKEENYDVNAPCGFKGLLLAMSILLGLRMLWLMLSGFKYLYIYFDVFISRRGEGLEELFSRIWAEPNARYVSMTNIVTTLLGLTLAILVIVNLIKKNALCILFLILLNVNYICDYIVFAIFSSQIIHIKDYLPSLVGSVLFPFYFLYSKSLKNTLISQKANTKNEVFSQD